MMEELQSAGETHPPPFSLKSKAGWLMGTALVLGVTGVGFYMRKNTEQENNRNSVPGNPVDNDETQSVFSKKSSGAEDFQYAGWRKNKHSRRSHSDDLIKETHAINHRLQTTCFTNNTLDIAAAFETSLNKKTTPAYKSLNYRID